MKKVLKWHRVSYYLETIDLDGEISNLLCIICQDEKNGHDLSDWNTIRIQLKHY